MCAKVQIILQQSLTLPSQFYEHEETETTTCICPFHYGRHLCYHPALWNIYYTPAGHQCQHSLQHRLRTQFHRQFLPYSLFHFQKKAVLEKGFWVWWSTSDQLPSTYEFAESISLVWNIQTICTHTGIRHRHSGKLLAG